MPFTKQHFQTIAGCIRAAHEELIRSHDRSAASNAGGHRALRDVANRLAVEFQCENPRFDRARFDKACEPIEAEQ
jgi:hypothetical protein